MWAVGAVVGVVGVTAFSERFGQTCFVTFIPKYFSFFVGARIVG